MVRPTNKLSVMKISALNSRCRVSDGAGLWLNVSNSGSKSWVFRWTKRSRVREMGIGPYPAVTLSNARKRAYEYRQMVANGLDPKFERDKVSGLTFGEAADAYFDAMQSRWTNDKNRWQWETTLKERCSLIRNRPIAEIETDDILKVLNSYWATIPETASRYRSRMEAVLDFARVKGWRDGDNPARWRGHLENILPKRDKSQIQHYAALPYDDLPAFYKEIGERDALAARALELLILTASRTSEVLKAKWDEFDFEKAIWTVPAERIKIRKDHRIPLPDAALEILRPLYETRVSEFVFPGQKQGKPLSNLAMEMMLRRMNRKDITVHGFRSTFRDWCGDKTSFPRELAEAALSHKVGSDVEQAYRRSDALERRRRLMEAWANYCLGKRTAKVVQIHA